MKRIIDCKMYDTEKADQLLFHQWKTYHPNQGGGEPHLDHKRGVYRGKKGTLFGHTYDEVGDGHDRNGVTGLYQRTEAVIVPFATSTEAVRWCEQEAVFDEDEIAKAFAEAIEEA